MEKRVRVGLLGRAGGAAVLALLAALAGAPAAGAQQASERGSATVFVSRLKAEPVDYQVKLTWIDSPDLAGTCVIYRSPEEISRENLARASAIGTVKTGVGYFVDTPPGGQGWYYAVLLRDSSGTLYPLLVQYRNKTGAPVTPQTSAPEQQLAAQVSAIRAAPTGNGDSIEVTFTTSRPARDLLLFWGPSAFTNPEDLLKATKTTSLDPGTTRYVLPVLPGIDYWFAVLDAGLFKLGQAPLVKGANTTAYPIQLQVTMSHGLPALPPVSRRGTPLPFLSISRGVETGQELAQTATPDLPVPQTLSDSTKKSITALRDEAGGAGANALRPQLLDADATPAPGGELGRLQDIVQGPFLGGDMTLAQKMLHDYLSLPRKADLGARARFYLGQVLYFQGKMRDALLEFLTAEDFYYQQSQPWIDACMASLEKADS